jgi:hypothetical protein
MYVRGSAYAVSGWGWPPAGDGEPANAKSDALVNQDHALSIAIIGTLVLPVRGQLLGVSGVKSSTARAPEVINSSKDMEKYINRFEAVKIFIGRGIGVV